MKSFTRLFTLTILSLIVSSSAKAASGLVLIGKIPGQYIKEKKTRNHLGMIRIEDRFITNLSSIELRNLESIVEKAKDDGDKVVVLKRGQKFDVIYPGLIDLHGHNKQNVLPTWTGARGRYANRWEWRGKAKKAYTKVQGDNMNPWAGAGQIASQVAAYRWTEMQAMVLGTTYLQGHSVYHGGFAIQSTEDPASFHTKRADGAKMIGSSNGNMIEPTKWYFLMTDLYPVMKEIGCENSYECYQKSVGGYLKKKCKVENISKGDIEDILEDDEKSELLREQAQAIPQFVIDEPTSDLAVDWFTAMKRASAKEDPKAVGLGRLCNVSDKKQTEIDIFFAERFGNMPHQEIVKRNALLDDPNLSSIITHMSEGRKNDFVNWTEFQMLKLAGWGRKGMNFIHGVALNEDDYEYMADNEMGVVWSPYSNMLLYGETMDIKAAIEAGVTIGLGSDWTPTGSKSVLEELVVATNYLDDQNIKLSNSHCDTTDECVYNMVTKNNAIIMNQYGYESKSQRGVGTLEKGALGTVIVVAESHENPFTNLVRHSQADDINLVVVDGNPIYGNKSYVEAYDDSISYEVISNRTFDYTLETHAWAFPKKHTDKADITELVASAASELALTESNGCQFEEPKVFVQGKSTNHDENVAPLKEGFGLDLDTYEGITKYLGVALLTQSKNVEFDGSSFSHKEGAVKKFPPLYSCDDQDYLDYLMAMANPELSKNTLDEMTKNRDDNRAEINRNTLGLYELLEESGRVLLVSDEWVNETSLLENFTKSAQK